MNDNRDHLRALFAAYVEATGLALTLSPERMRTLREFDRRGFTPSDVRGVMQGLKAAIARGVKGYTDDSLAWRNAMAKVDVFEERVLKYRQAQSRRAGKAREAAAAAPKAVVRELPEGGTLSVIASAPEESPVKRIDMKKALHDLAERVGGRKP